jgi:hypothetical protein
VPDPVHSENGKWYFWDETGAYRHGPFSSEQEARSELKMYADWLDSYAGIQPEPPEDGGRNG